MRIAIEDKESLENLEILRLVHSESPTELVRIALRWAAQRVATEEREKVARFQQEQADDGLDLLVLQGLDEPKARFKPKAS